MDTMTTVSEVLNNLKKEGYTVDFNLEENCLVCQGNALQVYPDEFVVDKHYRFEGLSDPGDEAVVYAISSEKHQLKGTLVNGYGIYSDETSDEMVRALKEKAASPAANNAATPAEEKPAKATTQRPEGDRTPDAPMVVVDLTSFRSQIKTEQAWQTSDRNAITICKTNVLRIVLIALHAGAEMKTHTAPGMISVQVLEGHITFRTEQQTTELVQGQLLALQQGIPHSVLAREESVFLLTLTIAPTGK